MSSYDEARALRLLAAICHRHDLSSAASAELSALVGSLSEDPDGTVSLSMDGMEEGAAWGPALLEGGERYEDLGLLGLGGMGEVRRVRDRLLGRGMAMKILHPSVQLSARGLARFIEEAQVTAQLQHPGIVPVHDLGQLPDGRWYFTMQEVRGRTLATVIREVHRGEGSFRRLVDAFLRVCEAVAYAHARGVLHRDLKPSNAMLGTFGEVLVLDWGLARVIGGQRFMDEAEPVITHRQGQAELATVAGAIAGTPAYMAPEQAWGDLDLLGPATDVYALGAILHELLSGRPPYAGTPREVLDQVRQSPPPPPEGALPVPDGLREICLQAMERDPGRRPAHAGLVAAAVQGWLDGARRQARARALLEDADALQPQVERLHQQARTLQEQAEARLQGVAPHRPIEEKLPGWQLEDEARAIEAEARLAEARWMQRLQAALVEAPELPGARDRLSDWYRDRHAAAEARGDAAAAAEAEMMLRAHDQGRHAAYLSGDGALSLQSEPTGALCTLFRVVEHERRLVPIKEWVLGLTPLVEIRLPMGSWMLRMEAPGHHPVDLPVFIGRQEHWDNRPPDEAEPRPVRLLPEGSLGPEDCYVPAGWFQAGHAEIESAWRPGRVWVEGFLIERYMVTNRRYLTFLDDLERQGRMEEAIRFAPQHRAGSPEFLGDSSYRREGGHWVLGPDGQGETWHIDWPVFRVDHASAVAFARWVSERTGRAWRLPGDLEWEKAARGTDGRIFPWGNHFDSTFCRSRNSLPSGPATATIHETPLDRSPYGVVGLGGNVNSWCCDAPGPDAYGPPPRRYQAIAAGSDVPNRWGRGGAFTFAAAWCRSPVRYVREAGHARDITGIRLVSPLSDPPSLEAS